MQDRGHYTCILTKCKRCVHAVCELGSTEILRTSACYTSACSTQGCKYKPNPNQLTGAQEHTANRTHQPPLPVPGGKVHTLGNLASTCAPRSAMRCACMRQPPLPPYNYGVLDLFQKLQTRRDQCPGAHFERTATLPYPAGSAPQHACASRR